MKSGPAAILDAAQAAYLESIEPARDALLAEMERYADEHDEPISDPEVASFLAVTVRAAGSIRIVEVGTNIGYGAIVLARAAGPTGRVTTIERNPATVEVARAFIARAGLAARIDVRLGDAIEELTAIEGEIDLAYVDCVKEDYPRYLELIVPRLSARGVVVADNVLWKGLVASAAVPPKESVRVEAIRAFNKALVGDSRLRGVILPLGDGVGYAARTS